MKYFYDTEFIEGKFYPNTNPTIQLISIGIVGQINKKYYAISKDFDLEYAFHKNDGTEINPNYWLRENVLIKLFPNNLDILKLYKEIKELVKLNDTIEFDIQDKIDKNWNIIYQLLHNDIQKYGKSLKEIKDDLIEFFSEDNDIDLYGYYSAYDHVVLCWLFGRMIDLPKNMPMYTFDIKQQIDILVENLIPFFDKNYTKNQILKLIKNHPNFPKESIENHNALTDAKWTRDLYNFIKNINVMELIDFN